MFSPLRMMRLNLLVLEKDERSVLRALADSGAVQLLRTQPGPETAPLAPRDRSVEISRYAGLLARIEELRRALEIAPAAQISASVVPLSVAEAEEKLRVLEARTASLLRRRQELLQQFARLTDDYEQLSSYRGLEFPLDQPDQYSFLHFATGTLPTGNFLTLQTAIADHVALLPLSEKQGRQRLIAMTTRQAWPALEIALERAGFEAETLPAIQGATADSSSEDKRHEREALSQELKTLDVEVRALADQCAQPLAELQTMAELERRLLEAGQSFPGTGSAILMTGWVPAADAPALADRVHQTTAGRCVLETAPPDNPTREDTPVLLRHSRWLRPFEMLVAAYGLPQYREVEPTLFVAISYVLMFGMMFGDLGQGAVLAAAGLALLLLSKSRTRRDLGLMLLCGGCSSMAFGATYGSCFGLPSFKRYAFWRDPLEGDPMGLMFAAIGMGIVLISLGLLLNIVNRFRRGDWIGGLLDKFGLVGVPFYWGMLLVLTQFQAIQSRGLVNLALLLFLVLPLIGMSLKEPLEYFVRHRAVHSSETSGGLFAAITESLVGSFEAVLSYLANTISFVRLAAYAMSHAALLAAAFMMAAEVRHLSTGGSLLSVAVIVLGNLVAIALEGIIASVQALRLEYYEFFGKFFSGAGRPFEPFRLTPIPG